MADLGTSEGFEAECRDFARLMEAIRQAQAAPLEKLRDLEWIHQWICSIGVANLDPAEETYANQVHLMNASFQGVSQYPLEFARWLHFLGDQRIRSYFEIGCFNGATACLATAYLRRFEPAFRCITIDLWPWYIFEDEIAAVLPVEYHLGKLARDFRGQQFDAVFIDGDHSFEWSWQDYQNVGRHARVCAFHDIRSLHYQETLALGGVTGMWAALKKLEAGPGTQFHEFCDHPAGDRFGIGVRVREI
jgi:hypothetical protein